MPWMQTTSLYAPAFSDGKTARLTMLGHRSDDATTARYRTEARHCRDLLLSRPFHVSAHHSSILSFSSNIDSIVIITSIVVAATAAAVSKRFDSFSTVGGIIGSSVSAAFLILLGIMNAYILYKLVQQMRKVLNLRDGEEAEAWKVEGRGILFAALKKMFKLIDRWAPSVTELARRRQLTALDPGKCTP